MGVDPDYLQGYDPYFYDAAEEEEIVDVPEFRRKYKSVRIKTRDKNRTTDKR